MRILPIAVALLLGACSNIPGYPAKQAQDDACFLQTSKAAFSGDFHDIVLPAFVPGTHLYAGQISSCMAR
jgi:hypothetical protein